MNLRNQIVIVGSKSKDASEQALDGERLNFTFVGLCLFFNKLVFGVRGFVASLEFSKQLLLVDAGIKVPLFSVLD